MEQRPNQDIRMKCEQCSELFDVPYDANHAFCVHCGAKQSITPKNYHDLKSDKRDNIYNASICINKLIKITDPDERRNYIEKDDDIPDPLRGVYRDLWHLRFKPSKVKNYPWADSWLGFFQELLMLAKNPQSKRTMRRVDKIMRGFFQEKSFQAVVLLDDTEQTVSATELLYKKNLYLTALYHEFLNVVYLYTKLSMNDKNYGSILFGFGRKKDASIAEKVSGEFIDLEVNLLDPFKNTYYGYDLIIKVLHDGYRAYFDTNFIIDV
ncbi:MAG TPA: hypothetical protein GX717_04190 [Clostridiaceae bacterium]|nr:hypothetical protein [Clostridiaceae bacterium]